MKDIIKFSENLNPNIPFGKEVSSIPQDIYSKLSKEIGKATDVISKKQQN